MAYGCRAGEAAAAAAAATQRRRGRRQRQRQRRPRVAGALLNGSGGMWATDFKHHGAKAEG